MTEYITIQQGKKIIKKMIKIIELNENTIYMIQSFENKMERHTFCGLFPDSHNLLISAGMHKKHLKDLLETLVLP